MRFLLKTETVVNGNTLDMEVSCSADEWEKLMIAWEDNSTLMAHDTELLATEYIFFGKLRVYNLDPEKYEEEQDYTEMGWTVLASPFPETEKPLDTDGNTFTVRKYGIVFSTVDELGNRIESCLLPIDALESEFDKRQDRIHEEAA